MFDSSQSAGAARQSSPEFNAALPQATEDPALDVTGLVELIGTDRQQHLRLLQSFAMNAPATLSEFHEVKGNRFCPGVGKIAHKLRSSALSVCAAELANVCLSLETAARKEAWDQIDLMVPLLEAELHRVRSYIEEYSRDEPLRGGHRTAVADEPSQPGALSVLLVDDDPQALILAKIQLANLDITAVTAKDCADEALAFLKENVSTTDVIVCDLNMPGRDGLEFIRLLSETSFEGGLLLISGENDAILSMAGKLARERGLQVLGTVSKPLSQHKLGTLLNSKVRPAQSPAQPAGKAALQPLDAQDLARAIADGEIVAHFQPKIDISRHRVAGVEALVRWEHPVRGLIPPVAFLPIAEHQGLINSLTDCVLEQGMACAAALQASELDVGVAINLAASTLTDLEWPDHAATVAKRHGIATKAITFEVTETGLVADPVAAVEILTRLRLKGFQLSIDDFGTGYSSMEQLLLAPFTELKIDRGFVRGAMTNPAAAAILESSTTLARRLGLQIVAEGVETRAELAMVATYGCDIVQGYFLGKPMPYGELRRWLRDWPDRARGICAAVETAD